MDALRGGLMIPKGMTGLATGAGGGGGGGGGGILPSSRGKKHSERVSYFADLAATETPASKPGVHIPGQQQRPLTSSLTNSPWWSPERLRQTLGSLAASLVATGGGGGGGGGSDNSNSSGSGSNHRFSMVQTVAGVVAFLFVAVFLVVGIVAETRSRSPSGGFGMRGVGVGAAVTTGERLNADGEFEIADQGQQHQQHETSSQRKSKKDMFGGAFTGSWIQPSRKSGHEHARSKLYNIIAPSPPPPAAPPSPPPPAPMLDFQRWCTAAQVLTGDQLLFAPIKQFLARTDRDACPLIGPFVHSLVHSFGPIVNSPVTSHRVTAARVHSTLFQRAAPLINRQCLTVYTTMRVQVLFIIPELKGWKDRRLKGVRFQIVKEVN